MSDAIGKPSGRPLTGPLRMNQAGAQPEATQPDATRRTLPNGMQVDRKEGLGGLALMQNYVVLPDPILELKREAGTLLVGLTPLHQGEANRMLNTILDQAPKAGESLEAFRSRLKSMMEKFQQFVESKKAETEVRTMSVDTSWYIFYQSLERYLNNLQDLTKIEGQVLDRKLQDQRSTSKQAERQIDASAAQAPEQRLSLLSAKLSQKP